jgi:SulP family sulfate permease
MADATAMQALADLTRHFQRRGVKVLLCEASPRINEKLRNFGLLAQLGQADARIGLVEALDQVDHAQADAPPAASA